LWKKKGRIAAMAMKKSSSPGRPWGEEKGGKPVRGFLSREKRGMGTLLQLVPHRGREKKKGKEGCRAAVFLFFMGRERRRATEYASRGGKEKKRSGFR